MLGILIYREEGRSRHSADRDISSKHVKYLYQRGDSAGLIGERSAGTLCNLRFKDPGSR